MSKFHDADMGPLYPVLEKQMLCCHGLLWFLMRPWGDMVIVVPRERYLQNVFDFSERISPGRD
jgi:hypothetical protein